MSEELGEGDEPSIPFVPERQACAVKAVAKGKAPGIGEDLVVPKDFGKTVERDSAGQVMNVVNADVPGDPAQNSGPLILKHHSRSFDTFGPKMGTHF